MTVEEKRLILKDKVAEGKRRIAERDFATEAKEAAEEAASFVGKHPLAFLGGALAIGLIFGSRGKKKAVAAASPPKKKPNIVAALLAEAAIAQGLKMIDKAKAQTTGNIKGNS